MNSIQIHMSALGQVVGQRSPDRREYTISGQIFCINHVHMLPNGNGVDPNHTQVTITVDGQISEFQHGELRNPILCSIEGDFTKIIKVEHRMGPPRPEYATQPDIFKFFIFITSKCFS